MSNLRYIGKRPANARALVLGPLLLMLSGLVSPAQPPGWWTSRGVRTIDAADDYAVANAGQLKNMATNAFKELQAHLPGGVGDLQSASGTGYQLSQMVAGWHTSTENADDYAAINQGQLKAVAKLFYARLKEVGYCNSYPWDGGTADNFAVANLGQLKYLFAFDVTLDSDGDGIPDWWEIAHGLNPHDPNDAGQLSGDGQLTNLDKYNLGLNPTTADSDGDGIPDAVEIANGTDPTHKDAPVVALKVTGFTTP